MIHINRRISDLQLIQHAPELYREAASYLLYCQYELLEYADEEDLADHDFNMFILDDREISHINDLGPPEEIAIIRIESCGDISILQRLDYPTVIFLTDSMLKPETLSR